MAKSEDMAGNGLACRYTTEQIKVALKKSGGNVEAAARVMGCSKRTIYNHMEKKPAIKEAREKARDRSIDIAECKLQAAVTAGERWAVEFTLRTIGKGRGYSEKIEQELTGKDGGPVPIVVLKGAISSEDLK